MRVALIVRALPCHRPGGLEYHTFDLANALQARGCSVVIITSAHPQGRAYEVLESGVEVHYLRAGAPGDYSLAFFRGVEDAVAELDKRQRFDVIHAQEFAGLAMRARPGRFVATVHGTLTTETPVDRRYLPHLRPTEACQEIYRSKARLALIPFFRRMLRRVDGVVVDSHFTEAELRRQMPWLTGRIKVVPLGVDFSRYDLPSAPRRRTPEGPLRLVMLGRAHVMRGILEALAACYRLRWHNVPFQMRIGGAETPPGWVNAAIAHFLLEDEVSFEGRVDPAEVSDFLSWGDLFLFADRTQPAFGLACVEAMLHGLPVLATRVGAIPEMVHDEVGWLCEPWNTQDMTTQLVRIASHRDRLHEKALRAWEYARTFTADSMAERMLALYASLHTASLARKEEDSYGPRASVALAR